MSNGKLTPEEFTIKAIARLRRGTSSDGKTYKGIHTVYSGFNTAFKEYFGGSADPVAVTTAMCKAGKIGLNPTKGGATIYLPEDDPRRGKDSALAKILAD